MNVLMLSTAPPYPPTHGGALRVWNVLKQVAKRHSVTFICMALDEEEPLPDHIETLQAHACRVEVVRRPNSLRRRACNGVRSIAGSYPFTLWNFQFPGFVRALEAATARTRFDLVHAHFLHTAQYHPHFGEAARFFDCHNINEFLWRRYAETRQGSPWRARFAQRQARLLARVEPRIHEVFDAVTFCSDLERAYAAGRCESPRLFKSPNGVDCAFFLPDETPIEPHTLIFSASMNATQNIDAVMHFVHEAFPRIEERYPDTKLYLVGQKPATEVQALASDRIIVTGTVEDVRPYAARAQVYVVPIRIGGGTRLKILEAMAMGKAIVSTTVGAEGIDCHPGEDLLLADGPGPFAETVCRLFEDDAKRRALGEAARAHVQATYEWGIIGERIEDYYEIALQHRAERRKETPV